MWGLLISLIHQMSSTNQSPLYSSSFSISSHCGNFPYGYTGLHSSCEQKEFIHWHCRETSESDKDVLWCTNKPMALAMSVGTLFPASSRRERILLAFSISMNALPPSSPMLFQRKSVHTHTHTHTHAYHTHTHAYHTHTCIPHTHTNIRIPHTHTIISVTHLASTEILLINLSWLLGILISDPTPNTAKLFHHNLFSLLISVCQQVVSLQGTTTSVTDHTDLDLSET